MIPLASFHGAAVPVTVRPWMPNWMETQTATEGGANATVYSGTDYLALKTVAETLNFTVNQVEARDFVEVRAWSEGVCTLVILVSLVL